MAAETDIHLVKVFQFRKMMADSRVPLVAKDAAFGRLCLVFMDESASDEAKSNMLNTATEFRKRRLEDANALNILPYYYTPRSREG